LKRHLFPLLLILLLLLAGCQSREVNNTTSVLGLGVDWEDNQIETSVQMTKPVPPEQAGQETPFVTVSTRGATLSEAARQIFLSIPRQTIWAHSSTLFLGEKLVQRDLSLIMDLLARNVEVRKSSLVFITQGFSTGEIMQSQTPLEPYSCLGIRDLLQAQEKQLGIYVPVKLGEFIYRLSTPGIDPLVPQVTLEKQGDKMTPTLKGSAAFRGKKMVGSLNKDETRGYRWMQPKTIQGGIVVISSPLDPQKKVTLELIRSQSKTRAEVTNQKIRMQIEINAEGNFYEQNSTGAVLTPENIKIMEELASREITRQCSASIARAQSLGSDIFGWGRQVESASPETWKQVASQWNEVFSEVEADVQVKFSIRRTYLTDSSFVFR
jgi:spore germination protein KC